MNKFNLTITVLIVAVVVFFGVGIFQKANYQAAEGDSLSISYTLTEGENSYEDQYASVIIGSNTNPIFTDEVVTGVKYGADFNFDTKLTEDITLSDTESTVVPKGTDVSIEATLTDVIPAADDTESEAGSETESE